MRKIKVVMAVLFVSFLHSSLLFSQAKSGFTFSLVETASFGVIDVGEDEYLANYSSLIQTGYLFGLSQGMGVSMIGELGYSYGDSIYRLDDFGIYTRVSDITRVHSFQLGLMPTFNLYRFSFGLGFGIKIPIDVSFIRTSYNDLLDGTETFEKSISGDYNPTPYIKLQIDYSLFIDTRTAIVLGINAQYDFDASGKYESANPENFYLGFVLGLKIGPKL